MERDSKVLTAAAEAFHLEIGGVKFWTPYWINWSTPPYFKDAPLVGKGSADEIKQELHRKLAETKSRPETAEGYRALMLGWGLGIDCSGLAYHILADWLKQTRQINLSEHVFAPKLEVLEASKKESWQKANVAPEELAQLPEEVPISTLVRLFGKRPEGLINVARLTAKVASRTIDHISESRTGDLIKMTGPDGDHLGVIVEVALDKVRYVESRGFLTGPGTVRYQDIIIKKPGAGLDQQDWEDRKNFDPKVGDRLCRLRVLDEAS